MARKVPPELSGPVSGRGERMRNVSASTLVPSAVAIARVGEFLLDASSGGGHSSHAASTSDFWQSSLE